jgi:hypothetical protein
MKIRSVLLMCCIACCISVGVACAGELELDKKWIKDHMNQATTGKITFHIREAKDRVNGIDSSGDDGDLHIAGDSKQVGLPMVAEIINAKQSLAAVKFAQGSKDKDVDLNGVWRIWFEHPPSVKQKQFAKNPLTGHPTNPDHMFEIHPISLIGTFDLIDNLTRVEGYHAQKNDVTFKSYETRTIDSWKVTSDSVIIESPRAVYNYADFVIRLTETPKKIAKNEDKPRYLAQADVLDTDCSVMKNKKGDNLVSAPRRMVFVEKDADKTIAKAKPGATFQVMGIPRVNLERLTFYMNHPTLFDKQKVFLPYEMIVIGAKAKTCKK